MAPVRGRRHVTHVLETERLVLRHLAMDDLDDLSTIYADAEVRRYFPEGTLSRAETAEEIAWMLEVDYPRFGYGLWATVLKEDGRFIGRCGLLPWIVVPSDRAEIGLKATRGGRCRSDDRRGGRGGLPARTEHWGRGLASESARAIVDLGFTSLGVRRLIALVDERNVASRRVAERAGLRVDGHVEEGGEVFPLHTITRDRWTRSRR
jgi:ribosomal-protein-alanine N-acetyltransferase